MGIENPRSFGKVVEQVVGLSAVVFVPDDTSKTAFPRPLMLQPVLGAPLLQWLAEELYRSGVERFFLVCHDRYKKEAQACLPAGAEVMTALDSNAADLLHVFLSTAEETEDEITIITAPVVWLPRLPLGGGARPAGVFRARREALMDALDEEFSFSRFLRDNCSSLSDHDGYYLVDSPAAALELATLLRRDRALRYLQEGVLIDDPDRCDIGPAVRLEAGVRLLPGVSLRGNTVIRTGSIIGPDSVIENSEIGPRCVVNASQIYGAQLASDVTVGPWAHIRPGSTLARGVRLGNFVEVKNASIGENTWASHLSYIGDAQVGAGCNLGSGTATVNFDRVDKYRTVIEDNAFVGCHAALIAPVTVGEGAYIAAGSVITEDVPPAALGIARARQSNKRDWAGRHKLPKE